MNNILSLISILRNLPQEFVYGELLNGYSVDGKGKVTRFYILRGLNKWINKTIVDEAIKEFNITPEQMEEIVKLAMMGI